MNTPFDNMIRFGVKFPKKNVVFPKNWQNLRQSIYNDEDNFAILTGKINDIIVVDLDIKNDDEKSLNWFRNHFGEVNNLNTLVTRSVNGGYHIFFKYNAKIRSTSFKEYNVDILSDKRCCFDGNGYEIILNKPISYLSDDKLNILTKTKNSSLNKPLLKTIVSSKDEIWEYIDGLSICRADERDSWLKVGYILSNYSFGEDLFYKFSKKSTLFNEERHKIDWNSIINGNCEVDKKVTIATIVYWLREDNPTLYDKILAKKDNNKILRELDDVVNTAQNGNSYNINHSELTRHSKNTSVIEALIAPNFGLTPVHNLVSKDCTNIKLYTHCTITGIKFKCYNCLFEFPPESIPIDKSLAPTIYNTLVINEDISNKETLKVAMKIKDSINLIFTSKRWYNYDKSSGIYIEKDKLEILNIIDDIVQELRDSGENKEWFNWTEKISYKKTLLEELEAKCYTKESLDDRPFLLGMQNGVFDLSTGYFRKGNVDEYITMKCKFKYDSSYDTSLAEKILHDIFPVEDEYTYALNKFSLILEGINRSQTITLNYGFTASNGKSFIMERINNALGDYSNTFPVNLLTNKMKGAGEANSTLIEFKNKRFMYCSEPEARAKLNTNFVKMLTGDVIKARGLYSNSDECIKPTYDVFVCCNVLPNFDSYDEGIARRIKLLDYKTKFCENPKKRNEKSLKRYSIDSLEHIECGLLHLFIKNYVKLQKDGFVYTEPDFIEGIRKLYINDNKDEVNNLLLENYEIGDNGDYVRLKDIKKLLKNNGLDKDFVSIKYIILEFFPDCSFFDAKMINGKRFTNIFTNLREI